MTSVRHLQIKSQQLEVKGHGVAKELATTRGALKQERAALQVLGAKWTAATNRAEEMRDQPVQISAPMIPSMTRDLVGLRKLVAVVEERITSLETHEASTVIQAHTLSEQGKRVNEMALDLKSSEESLIQERDEVENVKSQPTQDELQVNLNLEPQQEFKFETSNQISEIQAPEPQTHVSRDQNGGLLVDMTFHDSTAGSISVALRQSNDHFKVVCSVEDTLLRSRLRERLKRSLSRSGLEETSITVQAS